MRRRAGAPTRQAIHAFLPLPPNLLSPRWNAARSRNAVRALIDHINGGDPPALAAAPASTIPASYPHPSSPHISSSSPRHDSAPLLAPAPPPPPFQQSLHSHHPRPSPLRPPHADPPSTTYAAQMSSLPPQPQPPGSPLRSLRAGAQPNDCGHQLPAVVAGNPLFCHHNPSPAAASARARPPTHPTSAAATTTTATLTAAPSSFTSAAATSSTNPSATAGTDNLDARVRGAPPWWPPLALESAAERAAAQTELEEAALQPVGAPAEPVEGSGSLLTTAERVAELLNESSVGTAATEEGVTSRPGGRVCSIQPDA